MIRCKAPRVNPRWVPPRIEHPDLPAELQSATGELAAALWMRAVDMAQDQLAAAQLEAQRLVADAQARQAQARQAQAEAERDQVRQELAGSAAAVDAAQTRITELDQALAISAASASTLQEQVRFAQQGEQQLQRALETARHDFASELDKLRADDALAQERLKAAETRALQSATCVNRSVFWRVIWMRCAPATRVISMKRRRRVSSETNWRCR
jgi:chromosome segregation ATPase